MARIGQSVTVVVMDMGGCQNYGPFLGTLNTRCRSIIRTPKRHRNFDNHPYIRITAAICVIILPKLHNGDTQDPFNRQESLQGRVMLAWMREGNQKQSCLPQQDATHAQGII